MFNVQNIVPSSVFRKSMSGYMSRLRKTKEPLMIIHNSKPSAVLVDPEYLEYLEKYAGGYYDAGDTAEVKRVLASGELQNTIPFHSEDYLE